MSHSIGNIIAASCSLGLDYAERLLKEVPASQFARFARPGGVVVTSNHPAFIFGHLSLYGLQIIEHLGADPGGVPAPKSFAGLFAKDATCRDDPEGTIYPGMEAIVAAFFDSYREAMRVVKSSSDAIFLEPNPLTGPLEERFPTIGAMHAFYVSGHTMVHLGQMSAWRRMMGLDPA